MYGSYIYIEKIMHSMLCVTGVYLGDISEWYNFFSFVLECELSEYFVFMLYLVMMDCTKFHFQHMHLWTLRIGEMLRWDIWLIIFIESRTLYFISYHVFQVMLKLKEMDLLQLLFYHCCRSGIDQCWKPKLDAALCVNGMTGGGGHMHNMGQEFFFFFFLPQPWYR